MNHADFWVVPSARASSWDEMPFFELAMSQTAEPLVEPERGVLEDRAELDGVLLLALLHFQRRRVVRYEYSTPPQRGQTGPLGQRSFATKSVQTSRSEK
jgi:hypothetical protein